MPDTTTGIVNVAKRQMQFTLFPNPAKNYVIVETSESVIGATMQITDITGREILSKPMVNSQSQIQTSGFSPGVYLVRLLVNGKGKFVRKLVVE
jgi:predicted secreted protein